MIEELQELNPWWTDKKFETGIIRQKYLKKIEKYTSSKEIVILNGVRRSGKTTLLFQTINLLLKKGVDKKKIFFVNFDSPFLRHEKDPIKKVIEEYHNNIYPEKDVYLFFDEIQNVEEWERYIKYYYDLKKYRIFISGSTSHLLENKLATLISGRYLQIKVFPLDFKEYLLFKDINIKEKLTTLANKNKIIHQLKSYINEGGFPKSVLEKDNLLKRDILKNYFDAIVYKDIISLNEVRNIQTLKDIVYYLFSNITSLCSHNNLAKIFGIDNITLKEYINYFKNAILIWEIPYFSYSLKIQNRNNKKICCIDNGLRTVISFNFSKDEGKLVENLVFIELKRREKEVYYWLSDKHKEVDFVIKNKDNSLTALNVSYTNDIDEREIKSLIDLKKEFKKTKELIILTKDIEKKEGDIVYIPLWKWLLQI